MVRNKKKTEKIRVCINLDKEILEKIDKYVSNLSGYVNAVLKNMIEKRKQEEKETDNILLCKENKKRVQTNVEPVVKRPIIDEPLDNSVKWWE